MDNFTNIKVNNLNNVHLKAGHGDLACQGVAPIRAAVLPRLDVEHDVVITEDGGHGEHAA